MNYRYMLVLFILLLFGLLGCDSVIDNESIEGSGNLITIEEPYSDFAIIEAGSAFDVNISKGTEFSVTIRLDDNLKKYLDLSQEGKSLKIFLQEGKDYEDVTLEAEITLPDIEGVNFSGATSSLISGFELDHGISIVLSGASKLSTTLTVTNININISGASNLIINGESTSINSVISGASNLTFINTINITENSTFVVSGASSVNLHGMGTNMNANVSGASSLQSGGFPVVNADMNVSGASSSTIVVTGLLNATVSGASKLYYYGTPELGTINITGASIFQALN